MNVDPLRQYATKMQDVQAPDQLIDCVLAQAKREHEDAHSHINNTTNRTSAAKPARRKNAPSPSPFAHRLPKIAAAAACVAALSVGVAFASGIVTMPSTIFSSEDVSDKPNSFALLAYAAENPDDTPGVPVTLNTDDFGWGGSSGPYYDPETGQFAAYDDWAGYKYGFNVACTGNNIQSVSYEIEGEHAYFETIDMEKAMRPSTQEEIDSGNTSAIHYTKETSFDYDNQESITDKQIVSIYLGYPVPDTVNDLLAQYRSGEQDRLSSEYSAGLDIAAAQTLANCRLILTATFADGSTQTKTYVIKPVANFDQLCTEYWKASDEWLVKYDGQISPAEEHPIKPDLYTISEEA